MIQTFPKCKDTVLQSEDVADKSKASQIPGEEEGGPQTFPKFWESVEDLIIQGAWAHTFPEQPLISILHDAAFLTGKAD
jgi:hypothetical protein